VIDNVTHRDLADIRERLARIEAKMDEVAEAIPALRDRLSVIERWKLRLMAVVSAASAAVTYFATELKRALLS